MTNAALSNVLHLAYTLGLFGALLSGSAWAFLYTSIPNPHPAAQMWITAVFAFAGGLALIAVVAHFALEAFHHHICTAAFARWEAAPQLGATISGAQLAELADLNPSQAWHERQFLERKAQKVGVTYEHAPEPNQRCYRFVRPVPLQ